MATNVSTNGAVTRGAIVITGASTGIGEACALRLDRAGFAVFAGVRKDADADRLRQPYSSPMLKIGDFARLSHVPVKTLRYYDEQGLITPAARRCRHGLPLLLG